MGLLVDFGRDGLRFNSFVLFVLFVVVFFHCG